MQGDPAIAALGEFATPDARRGFQDFKDWWHMEKNFSGRDGRDLMGREEAEDAWNEWEALGRPTVRLGTSP
jgi:hypothetical protein